ncbi:DNA-binding transcriptional regulator GbsR, MarR family [Saccharopolyspora kobensis]|uniref:DNA-binding transcriptional regulator GbsR, MarR family n=1 Tax=Saccharopolyspora kobensis TaxID=146035 RepID=A0A1H6EDR8_9PSEU|nr:MarR family transcriptional regulator [Saccharopolyspora kobensis]SEG95139.1 DNA-binding transcriptional regulator GbsR, MarR family [Saccharopolyspora kobensis]SFD59896.1 DNA-binding transcriptional regulator GbsR, MarR family [Saccharopolyspora kobensis]
MAEQRDPYAVRQFVERFALDLAGAGVPRMAARVFASLLVADDGRRTAAELAEVLEVSPAAVSGAVRYLTQVNLVAREPVPGQRRDQYRVLDDLWYASITNREARLADWDRTLAEGQAALGESSAAAQRLGETREFFEFLREEIPALMQKWHRQRRSS